MLSDSLFSHLIKNSVRCNHCFDVIVSEHPVDKVSCSCGKSAISGGTGYLRLLTKKDDCTPMHEHRRFSLSELRDMIRDEKIMKRHGKFSIGFHDLVISQAEKRIKEWYPEAIRIVQDAL